MIQKCNFYNFFQFPVIQSNWNEICDFTFIILTFSVGIIPWAGPGILQPRIRGSHFLQPLQRQVYFLVAKLDYWQLEKSVDIEWVMDVINILK